MPRAQLNNFNIYYEVIGNKNTDAQHTIFFANGNGNCVDDWKRLGYLDRFLAENFRIILMDALGYGLSDKPLIPEEYIAERRAADVIALLDQLNIQQCHFFGTSLGGSLGFVLAHLYPQNFLSLTIGMAHSYGTKHEPSNIFSSAVRKLLTEISMQQFVEHYEVLLGRKFPDGVRENYINNNSHALIAANNISWPDYSTALKNITVPVLLYAGELETELLPYLKSCAELIPNCELVIIPGKNHAETYWDGKTASDLLSEFIKKHAKT